MTKKGYQKFWWMKHRPKCFFRKVGFLSFD